MRLYKNAGLSVILAVVLLFSGTAFEAVSGESSVAESAENRIIAASMESRTVLKPSVEIEVVKTPITEKQPLLQPVDYKLPCFSSKKWYKYSLLVKDITETMQNYSELVTSEVIGKSVKGNDIYALTVGRGPVYVLVTAGVHARENANTPLLMQALFDYLYAATTGDVQKLQILDQVTLVIVPLVNPDGYQYCIDRRSGKKKTNVNNVDINRNFPCKYWGSKVKRRGNYYPGPTPGSEPETQAIMALFDRYNFTLAVDLHSRARSIISQKGGYTADDLSTKEDPNVLNTTSLSLAQYLLTDINYKQVDELYVKFGEEGTLTDYAFSRGVPTVTIETLKFKNNRLADWKEIRKEYGLFNWPNTLYKIAEFAQRSVQ